MQNYKISASRLFMLSIRLLDKGRLLDVTFLRSQSYTQIFGCTQASACIIQGWTVSLPSYCFQLQALSVTLVAGLTAQPEGPTCGLPA